MHERQTSHHESPDGLHVGNETDRAKKQNNPNPLADTPTTTDTCKLLTGDSSLTGSITFQCRKNADLTITRTERIIESTTAPVFNVRDPHLDHIVAELQFSNDPPDSRGRIDVKTQPKFDYIESTTKLHASTASTIVGSADALDSFSTTTGRWGDVY